MAWKASRCSSTPPFFTHSSSFETELLLRESHPLPGCPPRSGGPAFAALIGASTRAVAATAVTATLRIRLDDLVDRDIGAPFVRRVLVDTPAGDDNRAPRSRDTPRRQIRDEWPCSGRRWPTDA